MVCKRRSRPKTYGERELKEETNVMRRTRANWRHSWALSLSAGLALAACGSGGGDATGGGGEGGTNGEQTDAEISLKDVGTGGNVTPPGDAATGGQPLPGGALADLGAAVDTGLTADLGVRPDILSPDANVVVECAGHDVIDLNAALADAEAYDGTTAGAVATLAASCGGAAGGEVVFRYRVERPLNRLTFRTDFPETQTPTVVYVRTECAEPVDLACNRGAPETPGTRASVDGATPGTYFVIVDTGARDGGGPFRLAVDEDGASACRDLDDNDGDGLTDLADPGCDAPDDDSEQDPPTPPQCADTLDNDNNGFTDFPGDPQCSAAGDNREGPVCALDVPTTDVGIEGGIFPTDLQFQGADLAQGRCTFEPMPEHLFILTLDRAARVQVVNRSLRELGTPAAFYARTTCDDSNTELACSDPFNGTLPLGELQPGIYFVFAEASQQGGFDGGPVPLGAGFMVDIEFIIRPTHPICSDGIDNDRDGIVDLADPGCRDARDQDEADPGMVPFCANGQDDDGDGTLDFPEDEGCTGAGDACEEVDYIQCDGVCLDGQADPNNCGTCGTVCAPGVECITGYCGGAVPILANDSFGHHGSCDDWNQCVDAQGCADAACRLEGFGRAVAFDEGSCQGLPAQGIRCNLFNDLASGLNFEADYRGCELPVAYNIVCSPR